MVIARLLLGENIGSGKLSRQTTEIEDDPMSGLSAWQTFANSS
jgi:hypothetical protein